MSTKKKEKKASSAGATARLGGSGFVSFSDVVSSVPTSPSPQQHSSLGNKTTPVYTGDNSSLSVSCKKLVKKDTTTKIKALHEIIAIIGNSGGDSENADPKVLNDFLPFFAFAFSKLVYDDSWQVREKTGLLLQCIIERDKQSLGPFMKDSIGPWWQLTADPVHEVSNVFCKAFVNAIPPKRMSIVLLHLSSSILKYIIKCLRMEPNELKELTQCLEEELDEKYERMIRSNIDSLGKLINSLSSEQNQQVLSGVSSSRDMLSGEEPISYCMVFAQDSLWKHCKTKHSSVRRSIYKCLSDFSDNIPSIWSTLSKQMDFLATVLLSSLDEKYDVDLSEGLHAMIRVSKAYQEFWNKNAYINQLLQKLRSVLKSKPSTFYQFFLPVMSCLPVAKVGIYQEEAVEDCSTIANKGNKVIQSLNHLLSDIVALTVNPHFQLDVASCLVESVTFLTLRKPTASSVHMMVNEDRFKLFLDILMTVISSYVESIMQDIVQTNREAESVILNSLVVFHKNSIAGNLVACPEWERIFWIPLSEKIIQLFHQQFIQFSQSKTLCSHQQCIQVASVLKQLLSYADPENIVFTMDDSNSNIGMLLIIHRILRDWIGLVRVDSGSSLEDLYGVVYFLEQLLSLIKITSHRVAAEVLTEMFKESSSWMNLLMLGLIEKNEKYVLLSTSCCTTFSSLVKVSVSGDIQFPHSHHQVTILQALKDSLFKCSSMEGLYVLLNAGQLFVEDVFTASEKETIELMAMTILDVPFSTEISNSLLRMNVPRYQGMARKMSLQFKLAFLTKVCSCICLQEIARRVIDLTLASWKSEGANQLFIWLLLYISVHLKTNQTTYEQFFIDGDLLPWECQSEYCLDQYCAQLFLNRQDINTNDNGYYLNKPVDFYFPRACTWKSFVHDIFPKLHPQGRGLVLSTLSKTLNNLLQNPMMTPVEFSGHITAFLQLHESHLVSDVSLDILSSNMWKSKQLQWHDKHDLVPSDSLLLQSMVYMLCSNHGADESIQKVIASYFDDADLFINLIVALYCLLISATCDAHAKEAARSIILHLMRIFTTLMSSHREKLIKSILNSMSDDATSSPYDIDNNSVLLELVEKLVCLHYKSTDNYSSNVIQLHYPFPAQSLGLKDRECQYIATNLVTGDSDQQQEYGFKLNSVSCRNGKFVACHVENGPFDPYYSVLLGRNENTNDVRELQTEWNKLLFNHISGFDLFETYDPEVPGVDYFPQNIESSKDDQILLWLYSQILSIRKLIVPHAVTVGELERNVNWHQVKAKLAILSRLFGVVVSSVETHNELERQFCAPLRGLALLLTSEKFSYSANAVCSAASIIQILASSNLGIGNGLWFSLILKNIYSSPLLQLSMEQLSKKAIDIRALMVQLVHICSVLNGGFLESNFLNWLIENKVMNLLNSLVALNNKNIDSPRNVFYQIFQSKEECKYFIRFLKNHWKSLSSTRSTSENLESNFVVRSWETISFDFLLQEFVNALSVMERHDINYLPFLLRRRNTEGQWNILQGLHFAMFGRSREATSQLIRSSCFSLHLDRFLEEIVPSFDRFQQQAQQTPRYPDDFVDTERLMIGKLLDIWISSGSSWDCEPWPESPTTSTSCEHEMEDKESEEEESSKDATIFRYALGNHLFDSLLSRFDMDQIRQRSQHSLSQNLLDLTNADDDNDRLELPDHIVDQMNDLATLHEDKVNVSGGSKQAAMGKRALFRSLQYFDGYGTVLSWLLTLQSIDSVCVKHWEARARCGAFLKNTGIFRRAADFLLQLSGDLLKYKDISACFQRMLCVRTPSITDEDNCWSIVSSGCIADDKVGSLEGTVQQLACYALFRTISTLPAMFRNYWNEDCRRVDKMKLSRFVEERVRQSLIKREMALIRVAKSSHRWEESEFEIKGNATTGEIVASFLRDETKIEIIIKIPAAYPLKNVDVDCTSRIGVSDGRWRRWLLQMIQLLSLQDGSVVDAALLWKRNIEKEMEGVEPCPICYCTIHTKTLKLPTLACPTCKNKFHPVCLHTWFKTSGKSKCVLCQQPMYF